MICKKSMVQWLCSENLTEGSPMKNGFELEIATQENVCDGGDTSLINSINVDTSKDSTQVHPKWVTISVTINNIHPQPEDDISILYGSEDFDKYNLCDEAIEEAVSDASQMYIEEQCIGKVSFEVDAWTLPCDVMYPSFDPDSRFDDYVA